MFEKILTNIVVKRIIKRTAITDFSTNKLSVSRSLLQLPPADKDVPQPPKLRNNLTWGWLKTLPGTVKKWKAVDGPGFKMVDEGTTYDIN